MAKNDTAQTPEASFALSLNEFCTRLSQTDKRVELIAGYHHTESMAGRDMDTEENFRARYDAFSTQPA